MSNARWERIKDIYHAAQERPAVARSAFLREACGGDRTLLDEVQSLLDQPVSAEQFLASGASAPEDDVLSVRAGQRLGVYEVQGLLGRGGMGEVYRARDTRLGRDVAIKILPRAFTSDPERLTRFEREARVLASLNHPHIASIYGVEESDGVRALVLELVDGETLAERLARGPMPFAEALEPARQIADALEAAHEKGIVHRDLKPGNVKITPDGVVKVLDFGLAKIVEDAGGIVDRSGSPTANIGGTHAGMILGTAAYMSPEQARGQLVDKRTDIWAFGCVLYEILAGRPAFPGDTVSDTVAAVLERAPDWKALPVDTPATIRTLLRRCLEKDRKRRLDSTADARLEIDEALTVFPAVDATHIAHRPTHPFAWAITTVLAIVAGVLAWRAISGAQPTPVYASIDAPADHVLGEDNYAVSLPMRTPMVFTHDGRALIIVAARDGKSRLFLRPLDRPDAQPLAGTDGAQVPFLSPDGKWIGFWAGGEIRKVPLEGGAATTICSWNGTVPNGASWGADDTILLGHFWTRSIVRVPARGGATPVPVTTPPAPERLHVTPFFLPDGKRFLFADVSTNDATDSRLMVGSVDGGEARPVIASATDGRLLPSGRLAFMRLASLMTVGFDATRAEIRGDAVTAMSAVMQSGLRNLLPSQNTGAGMFAVSTLGALAAVRGPLSGGEENHLLWTTPNGQSSAAEAADGVPLGTRTQIRVSPDRSRAAMHVVTAARRQLWLVDWTRKVWNECRDCLSDVNAKAWSPDGRRLLLSRNGGMVAHTLDGSAPEHELLREIGRVLYPTTWLKDERVVYVSRAAGAADDSINEIKVLGVGSHSGRVVIPAGTAPDISPDGRWLAYQSMGHADIFVQPFPGPGPRTQISTGDGWNPAWSPDGRSIYYLRNGPDLRACCYSNIVMAADVSTGGGFTAGTPRELFRIAPQMCAPTRCYDVADGPRFLFRDRIRRPSVARMDLVLNWTATLPGNR